MKAIDSPILAPKWRQTSDDPHIGLNISVSMSLMISAYIDNEVGGNVGLCSLGLSEGPTPYESSRFTEERLQ